MDVLGHLVIRQTLGGEGADVLGQSVGGLGVLGHDDHMHALAQHGTGLADDRALEDVRVERQGAFHFDGEHLEAAPVQHVLDAIVDLDETVLGHRAHVARLPPAADEVLGVGLRVVPITRDHVRATHPDLALFAGRQFHAVLSEDADLGAMQRQAHAIAVRGREPRRVHGGGAGCLGRTIAVHQTHMRGPARHFLDGGLGHRRAAVTADFPGTQVVLVEILLQ